MAGYRYRIAGLNLDSQVPIAELHAEPEAGAPADIALRLGSVSSRLAAPKLVRRGLQITPTEGLFERPGAGRFLVRHGSEIIIQPRPGATPSDLSPHLFGIVLATLCNQRGLLVLHASAVGGRDQSIAFVGRAGIGKSTLAAWLVNRGFSLLSDDLCIISADPVPQVWPCATGLRLTADALAALTPGDLPTGPGKHAIFVNQALTSVPLSRIYWLQPGPQAAPAAMARLSGAAAMRALLANVYSPRLLDPMERRPECFAQCGMISNRVRIESFFLQGGGDGLGRNLACLERHLL